MAGQVNFFLDSVDDPLLPDGVPEFSGGQFSNWRANLLKPNQSSELINCDVDKLGKVRTRRGSERVGPGAAGAGTLVQGLTSYQTAAYNYIVAANGGKIWSFNGTDWATQIATGGAADNDQIIVFRTGAINQAVTSTALPLGGYLAGSIVLVVDGITGFVAAGEKLYFVNNLKNDYYEYTIASVTPAAPAATTQITLEEPGLVFDVADNWGFIVARTANINHAAYAGGFTGALVIDNFTGSVNTNEIFVIKSENVTHRVLTHTETAGNTTSINTWENFNATTGAWVAGALQSNYLASDTEVPIVFAQGNDALYFCDGVGSIYGWNGKTVQNLSARSALDYLTGSAYVWSTTSPPTACKILLWFQNRLIASGIATEPDAIYFSDYFDATSWDHNYQKIRVGGGESDPITGLTAWTDLNMLVTKKNSIYLINLDPTQNPNPDDPTGLVASFAVKQIHKRIGCPAPWTMIQVGGGSTTPGSDVFFLDGDKKVRSIRRVLAAETQQEVGEAISLPIQDVLDRCNLDAINQSVAFYHNDHYILAFPKDGATRPNALVAYNLLTQSWCGEWNGWWPTCFAMRTDLGDYTKMIFGQWNSSVPDPDGILGSDVPTGAGGMVYQWLDDQSLPDETVETYEDNGVNIRTQILTRAITFNDQFSYKTGLNVEFEFDESVADLTIQVILDMVPQHELLAPLFSTLSESPLELPVVLPFTLPSSLSLLQMAFDLQRYGTWRELQFKLSTTSEKLSLRSIKVTGFIDTLKLQSETLSFFPSLS